MSDFQIKMGDRLPVLNAVLTRSDGVPVDLSSATVHFVMRSFAATAPVVNAVAAIVGNPTLGQVSYAWQLLDTAVPGIYDGSWIVTFPDTTRQSFPTDDYLQIEVQLDLSAAGTFLPIRPTDGIRPPVKAVASLLATRGRNTVTGVQFGPGSTPTHQQVQDIIDMVASDVDGELAGVAITPQLAQVARWAITQAAAATVELTFWPEQSDNTGAVWWTRYQATMKRFLDLLEMEGGGPPESGTVVLTSQTIMQANIYADQLAAAGLLPDIWTGPPESWA